MNSAIPITKTCQIEYRENRYACNQIQHKGMILYQIVFNKSYLYLTKAMGASGLPFWTSIPQDPKLDHVVIELGKKIENQFK
jgi:hypothetical protein